MLMYVETNLALNLNESRDATDWVKAEYLLASALRLHWKDRPEELVQ